MKIRHCQLKAALAYTASASALLLSAASPAFAQDKASSGSTTATDQNATPDAAEENQTQDIVVTAQFRGQKLQDTPLAITAVSASQMEARSQTDVAQIAAQAPNVTLTPMGGAYGTSISAFIRGVGQNDFNPAYEPGVGMYIDDVYYATLTGANFDLLDLDRVEILRGPQGTLTGRNSIGGAIKLFSKKPDGVNEGSFEATYGSRNRVDLRATGSFALTDDLFVRASGVYKNQRGYVAMVDYGCANPGNAQGISATQGAGHCTTDYLGGRNYAGIRTAIRYNPSDAIDFTITGDYSKENRTNAADVVTITSPATAAHGDTTDYACGSYCTYANFTAPAGGQFAQGYSRSPYTTFEGWGVSGNGVFKLSDSINLTSITAYREYRSTWSTDDDFSPDQTTVGLGLNDLKFHFASQELRLNGKVGDLVEWTLGGFYSDQKTTYYTIQDIRYLSTLIPGYLLQFQGNDPVKAKSKAVFGTVILHPTYALTLTGGLRYTTESKDYTFVRKTVDGLSVNPYLGDLDGVTSHYDGDKVDWRISADYRFSPAVMAYATASTGFKGGGVSARPFTAAQAIKGTFKPETVTAFEIGAKTDLFDRRLRLDVSAFYNDYKDIQLPLSSCIGIDGDLGAAQPPCGARTNAGAAHFKGVEAELTAHPVDGLTIDGSFGYLDATWVKGSISSTAAAGSVNENDPAASPKWKWSVGAQYEADLGDAGTLTPRVDVNYMGDRFSGRALGYAYFLPHYTLANARLTWRNADRDVSVSLEVQNIFDKYYYTGRFDTLYNFTGIVYSDVGRPREWAVTVKKNF